MDLQRLALVFAAGQGISTLSALVGRILTPQDACRRCKFRPAERRLNPDTAALVASYAPLLEAIFAPPAAFPTPHLERAA